MAEKKEVFYGFHFHGKEHASKLVETSLNITDEKTTLKELWRLAVTLAPTVEFPVIWGTIRELTFKDGEVKTNTTSKVGQKRIQAFILKKKDDLITSGENFYWLKGVKIDMCFVAYDVKIVDTDT